jgi:hypothetical protein
VDSKRNFEKEIPMEFLEGESQGIWREDSKEIELIHGEGLTWKLREFEKGFKGGFENRLRGNLNRDLRVSFRERFRDEFEKNLRRL